MGARGPLPLTAAEAAAHGQKPFRVRARELRELGSSRESTSAVMLPSRVPPARRSDVRAALMLVLQQDASASHADTFLLESLVDLVTTYRVLRDQVVQSEYKDQSLIKIWLGAHRQMMAVLSACGMTPAARQRVHGMVDAESMSRAAIEDFIERPIFAVDVAQ